MFTVLGVIFDVTEVLKALVGLMYKYNCSFLPQYADLSALFCILMLLFTTLRQIVDAVEELNISSSNAKISLVCFVSILWFVQHLEILLVL